MPPFPSLHNRPLTGLSPPESRYGHGFISHTDGERQIWPRNNQLQSECSMANDFVGKCEPAAPLMKFEGEGVMDRASHENLTNYLATRCEFLVGRLQVKTKILNPLAEIGRKREAC